MKREEIDYIVEWFEGGNEERRWASIPDHVGHMCCHIHSSGWCAMSLAGQTIAKLASENRKLRQENIEALDMADRHCRDARRLPEYVRGNTELRRREAQQLDTIEKLRAAFEQACSATEDMFRRAGFSDEDCDVVPECVETMRANRAELLK